MGKALFYGIAEMVLPFDLIRSELTTPSPKILYFPTKLLCSIIPIERFF